MSKYFKFFHLFIVLIIVSCDSTIVDYEQISVYEFSTNSSEIKHIKTFGMNESEPFLRYFHNSNKKLISRYYSFYLIDESGDEIEIKSDVFISNSFFFDISPNDQEVIFSGFIPDDNYNDFDTSNSNIYKLDLASRKISLFHADNSANVNYPVFSNSGNQILYSTYGFGVGQEVGSKLVIMDVASKECITLDTNEFRSIRYAQFSADDKFVYYFTSPDKIYKYDLSNNEKTLFISNENFALNDMFVSGFPLFNLSLNYFYFYGGDESSGRFPPYYIYEYNTSTNSAEKLFLGQQPMSITDNFLLFRGNSNGIFSPSDLMIANKSDYSDIKVISKGNYGAISYDEEFVLYSCAKTIKY